MKTVSVRTYLWPRLSNIWPWHSQVWPLYSHLWPWLSDGLCPITKHAQKQDGQELESVDFRVSRSYKVKPA